MQSRIHSLTNAAITAVLAATCYLICPYLNFGGESEIKSLTIFLVTFIVVGYLVSRVFEKISNIGKEQ